MKLLSIFSFLLIIASSSVYGQNQALIDSSSIEICECIEGYPMATITNSFKETIEGCFLEYFTENEELFASIIGDNESDEITTEKWEDFGLKIGFKLRQSCPVVKQMNDDTGQKMYNRLLEGNSVFQAEGCEAASNIYTEVINNNRTPDSTKAGAYLNRGFCKSELGDYYGAIGDLNTTIAIAPNTALAYKFMGIAKRNLGNYADAIKDLDLAISMSPDVPEFYNERGLSYYYSYEPEAAIKDYKKALSIDSSNATFYFNLGLVYNYLEDYKKAVENFIQVYELNDTFSDLSYYTNMAYKGLDMNQEAIAVLLEDSLTESDKYNLNEIGLSYYYMEMYKPAIRYFTKSIALDSTWYSPFLYRAYSYQDSSLYQESLSDFNAAHKLDSTIPELAFYYGISQMELENFEEAISLFSEAISIEEDYAEAFDNRARAYIGIRDYENAISDFTTSLEMFPNDAQIYEERAGAYLKLDDLIQACKDLSLANELGNEVEELLELHCKID